MHDATRSRPSDPGMHLPRGRSGNGWRADRGHDLVCQSGKRSHSSRAPTLQPVRCPPRARTGGPRGQLRPSCAKPHLRWTTRAPLGSARVGDTSFKVEIRGSNPLAGHSRWLSKARPCRRRPNDLGRCAGRPRRPAPRPAGTTPLGVVVTTAHRRDRLDAAGKAGLRKPAGVPPRGFEPLISTLKDVSPTRAERAERE